MDYGKFPVYIKSNLIYMLPYLCHFLQIVQFKWWVLVWSFMRLDTTHAILEFIFKGLESLCLVVRQEPCKTLITREVKFMKKPNNPAVN